MPLDGVAAEVESVVDDALELHRRASPVGDVGAEHGARAAADDAVGQRRSTEPREYDGVDSADAHGREHQRYRFEGVGHVNGYAVALADAERAERGGAALDVPLELRVGDDLAFAEFVGVDERGVPALARLHLVIDAHVRQVGLRTDEPPERRVVGLEHLVPRLEPRQGARRIVPECIGVLGARAHPATHHRVYQVHLPLLVLYVLPIRGRCPKGREGRSAAYYARRSAARNAR